jgi:hypothetical protein
MEPQLVLPSVPRKQHTYADLGLRSAGTGTGIWVIDFADAHPESDVKGIGISPIQPNFVPPNCRFEVDDFNLEFYDDDKFDLIHQRELNGCIKDPPLFYQKCFAALLPGGWLDGE